MRAKSPMDLLVGSVGPRTWARYKAALGGFLRYLEVKKVRKVGSWGVLDWWLLKYFGELMDAAGAGARTKGVDVRSAILLILPNAKWGMQGSARALRGWSRLCPTVQRTPMPWEVYQLMLDVLRRDGNLEAEWVTMAGFEGYLRISEAVGVKVGDVVLREQEGVVALPKTKTGLNQSIVVRSGRFLDVTRRLCKQTKGRVKLVSFSAETYRRLFRKIVALLGVEPGMLTPHSLRHGGATDDYMRGVPMADIVVKGRWVYAKTAARYIQQGRALLVKFRVSPQLRRRMDVVRSARPCVGDVGKGPRKR